MNRTGAYQLAEKQLAKKKWGGVLVDKLNVSALKATNVNHVLVCIRKNIACRSREVIVPV